MNEFASTNPNHDEDPAVARLDEVLDRLHNTPSESIARYGSTSDLELIKELGHNADESRQAMIRPLLKRELLVSPPAGRRHDYITQEMTELVYSDDERQALQEAALAASQRRAAIAEAVTAGAEPWLAHVQYNERNILNPVTVGFYRDTDGKIRDLYGPRYFESKRQVPNNFMQSRSERKEVNLLDGEFQQVAPKGILRGQYWNALPDDLREHFERGEILVTTGNDHYATSGQDIEQLAQSDDPEAYIKLVDQKVRAASSDYTLLYYSDYGSNDSGRTAVVMTKDADGGLRPVVVQTDEGEYIVEIKGCGTKAGGYRDMHFRTGRTILTGAAEAEQAVTEFNRLEEGQHPGAPKAVGSILFDNRGVVWHPEEMPQPGGVYEQGYVIRLAPSTVRASFAGSEVYPDIRQPEIVDRVLDMYTSQLAEHMFADPPKILDRSSHSENILLWGDGEYTFTDYSDHVAFADKDFPHYDSHIGGDIGPKVMLEYYIDMVDQIPGYQDLHKQQFHALLSASLETRGMDVTFVADETVEESAQKIWEAGMAYQVFVGRQAGQYFPEGKLQQLMSDLNSDSIGLSRLFSGSAEEFTARESQARQALSGVLNFYRNNPQIVLPAGADIDAWQSIVNDSSFGDITALSRRIKDVQYYEDNYDMVDSDTRKQLNENSSFYGVVDQLVMRRFQEYYEHELDVVVSAQRGCPEESRPGLAAAEAEVRARQQYLRDLADDDLAGFFEAVRNPETAQTLLSFDFYRTPRPVQGS